MPTAEPTAYQIAPLSALEVLVAIQVPTVSNTNSPTPDPTLDPLLDPTVSLIAALAPDTVATPALAPTHS